MPTSATSKRSAGKGKGTGRRKTGVARPFDSGVLRRAREIAARYKIVVWFEDGEYYGRGVELPNAMNDGPTAAACVENVRAILATTVATLLEAGETPPPPAAEGVRSEQVNVRLTAEERLAMEAAAHRGGFRGVSDFLRAAGVAQAARA
jgi:predicted RNase H-like HicB family nuclease